MLQGEYKLRKIWIGAIKGNETLAKDIISEYDTLLMPVGTCLKKEYVEKLKELHVDYIYVEDELAEGVEDKEITENMIKEQCQEIVKKTLERYIQGGNQELERLKEVAQEIVYDLLEQPEIMFNMSGVRQRIESAYSHSVNVCALSVFLGLRMNLSERKIHEIAVGSLLHDIGYNNVTVNFKNRKYEELSEKEKKEMKMHVVYGFSDVEYETWVSKEAKEIILNHHERVDGSGYPMHLTGDRMRIGTKIVAVCDEFDRLVYGNFSIPMKVHEAIEYIVAQAGTKFDLTVVKIFNESVAAYPNGTMIITNDDELGIVLRQNQNYPTRPVIRLIKNKNGEKYKDWVEKNLKREFTLFIKDTVEEY